MPEHKGQAGVRGRGLLDGDGKRDHVGPERDRERAERSRENKSDHDEGQSVPTALNAQREYDRGKHADDGEDEQIWTLGPSVDDWQVLGERIRRKRGSPSMSK
jgi:hypothetical protein